MGKIRSYFQHHPIVHWLMSIVITFLVVAGFGLLVHEKDRVFLVGLSIIVPTALALASAIRKRQLA